MLEAEQALQVIGCRPEHLPTGNFLERRRDAPDQAHAATIVRLAHRQTRPRRAKGTQVEGRFHRITGRLLERERRQIGVVEPTLADDATGQKMQLIADGFDGQRCITGPAAQKFKDASGFADGVFPAFNRYISHFMLP